MLSNNLTLSRRLTLAFGLVALTAVALGLTGLRSSRQLSLAMDDMYANWTLSIEALSEVRDALQESGRDTFGLLLVPAEFEVRKAAIAVDR